MNKKGNILYFMIMVFVFVIFWIFALAEMLTLVGNNYIEVNHATGFELFFYSNLNLFVFIALILSILTYGSIQTRQTY
jgi:hypothetical protein